MAGKKKRFSVSEWTAINAKLTSDRKGRFGLPASRRGSVVIATFNIRSLGNVGGRSEEARRFLARVCERFDFVAIQEVQDDLSGIRDLHRRLSAHPRKSYGMVVSDVTGVFPGEGSTGERLAFLFDWRRIERMELASDITYDRSKIVDGLFERRHDFSDTFDKYARALARWRAERKRRKAGGRRGPAKPKLRLPAFVAFIRQPHCAAFRIKSKGRGRPIEFLAANAHLLYGTNKKERRWEFEALIEWLYTRAKQAEKMYANNLILLGDCNLEFDDAETKRETIDEQLKQINSTKLKSKKAAQANFPLLDPHPQRGIVRTNARQTQTYDQIGIFAHDRRLPDYKANKKAGTTGDPDAYDYGVFRFTDLFAEALLGKPPGKKFEEMPKKDQDWIIDRTQWDVSDHMPAWFRLPVPGA